ncbi:MAG: aminoalkylphosphonic acid N-acetyltransferase [Phycisphaerales bacterium]|nr:aminoalkylphosphonic acid N-acetyltransferase [Phycisphaerales bacterium]
MTSPADILFREAQLTDVPAIAALARAFAEYLRTLGDLIEFRLNAEALERDGFGPNPAFRGIVAEAAGESAGESAGEVVGYLLHHDGYDTDAACRLLVVADLFVAASVRGRGIGAALMQQVRDIAAASGAKQVVWTVYRPNTQARRFYEGIGGKHADTLDVMYLDV